MLLLVAAAEDIKWRKVSNRITGAVCLLGAVNVGTKLADRWETIVLTCLFLFLYLALYLGIIHIGRKTGKKLCFGGADIKLMVGAMLFFGWDEALEGMFVGLLAAIAAYVLKRGAGYDAKKQGKAAGIEIPLVPWLVCGMAVSFFLF